MQTLRIQKETSLLGTVKYYLMHQADAGALFNPIAFSYDEATILAEFEKSKQNLGIAGTTVIKQETF